MQEIVDAILSVEDRCAHSIEETRRRLAEERERVEAEIADSIKRARDQAAELIRSRVDAARAESNAQRESDVQRAREAQRAAAEARSTPLDAIVERIARLIVTPVVGPRS